MTEIAAIPGGATVGDYAIRAQFEAACDRGALLARLNSPEGIAGWWSDTVEGAAGAVGDVFRVRFPTTPAPFELHVEGLSDDAVEWHIPDSPPWWRGTTIRFELSEDDGGSRFMFTHGGFDAEDPIIPVITPAWVRFLDNLVSVAESGTANPAVVNPS